jgi:hypothetical protein
MYDFLLPLISFVLGYPQFFMYCITAAKVLFEKQSNAPLPYALFVRL